MFEEELTPILHKLFEKLEEKETLFNPSYQANISLIPELYAKTRQKKHPISYEYRYKKLQQNTMKLNPASSEKYYTPRPSEIFPKDARLTQHMKINQHNMLS